MLPSSGLHFSLVIHKNGSQSTVIVELLTPHSFPFTRLTVWTAMPTLALLPHLQPHSSHLPKLPLPHLPEVPCLRGQWSAWAAMLHLRQLYLEPMLPRLPRALHLLPSQPVLPTLQHARCRPPRLLKPRWSTTLAAISWLPSVWVRMRARFSVRVVVAQLNG